MLVICGTVLAQAEFRNAAVNPVICFTEFRKGLKLKDGFTK